MSTRQGMGLALVIAFSVLLLLGVRLLPRQDVAVSQQEPPRSDALIQRSQPWTPEIEIAQPRLFEPQAVDAESDLAFFPEALASQPPAPSLNPIQPIQLTQPPVTDSQTESSTAPDTNPPQELTPNSAAPINNGDAEKRKIVRDGLPNATDEERQVWLEELRSLPPDAIRDLLKLRKRFGPPPLFPSAPNAGQPLAGLVDEAPAEPVATPSLGSLDLSAGIDERMLPSIQALRDARNVILNNIANANTHGFRRSRVVLTDLSYASKSKNGDLGDSTSGNSTFIGRGVEVTATPLDASNGDLEKTNQPLDLAIDGSGFFQITFEGDTFYTRCGRFSQDGDGRLVLMNGRRQQVLQPTISVPADAQSVQVSESGIVSVLDSTGAPVEIGQLQITRFINPASLKAKG
ncbi:MAG: flagellar hook-basal body complex protein, partial [Planctomycetota bacterium]|nr:flagellar hook-basal body complex protein [Planctomycetota bacterium]